MKRDDERTRRSAYGEASPFRRAKREPLLYRTIPVAQEVPRYRFGSAGRDLLAGITVTALALPSAMAYGELAGLSPVNGIYALLAPTLAYVLLGSARRLVIGPEGSVSTLVAASVLGLAVAGSDAAVEAAGALALLVAACFLLAYLLRLGWIADYLSRPVLVGYLHGVAIVLVISQLGKLLGLQIAATEPLQRLAEVVRELGDVSGATVAPERRLAQRAAAPAALPAGPARRAARRRLRDRRLLDLRLRGARDRHCRPRSGRPSAPESADAAARRPAEAGAGGGRRLPRLVRGRDPHRTRLRRQARRACARRAGAARHGSGERGGRADAGVLGRRKRFPHGRERDDGRAHSDRRPLRRRDRRRRAAVRDRAGAVPAVGRSRRRARLGRDQHRRHACLARAVRDRQGRGRDRGGHRRVRRLLRSARGDRRRRRPLDHRHRAPKRPSVRRGARLGARARRLPRRRAAPDGGGDSGRGRLPARRPALLRQRLLRQGARARGDPCRPERDLVARVRRRSGHARRLEWNGHARRLQRELDREGITLVVARLRQRMLADLEAADLVEQIGRERFYPSVNRALAAFEAERGGG